MEIFMASIAIITGLYLVWLGIIMQTKNLISESLFKILPCILGAMNFAVGIKILN